MENSKPTKMKNTPLTAFLTVREVSQLVNVHPNTIRRWSELGIIKAYRIGPAAQRRFKRKDVDTFLRKSTIARHVKASILSHK